MLKRIAFDVTGVIQGKWGGHCSILIESLHKDGWEIFILSPNEIDTIYSDMDKSGIKKEWIKEIINRGDKGKACKEFNISFFIDDDPSYVRQVLSESLETMPLWRSDVGSVLNRWHG